MRRMMTRKFLSKMEGLTLIETMLALAIAVLIVIAAVVIYISVKTSATTNKVVSDMNTIVGAADTYISGGQPASNLTAQNTSGKDSTGATVGALAALQGASVLPNPFNDPWGLAYSATVTAATASTATITITIPGILGSDSNCQAINSATQSAQGVQYAGSSGSSCSFTYPL